MSNSIKLTRELIADLEAGSFLNERVHKTFYTGQADHWSKIPDYSTNMLVIKKALETKRVQKKFYAIHTSLKGYTVIFDYGKEEVSGNTFCEAISKAFVVDWMIQNNLTSIVANKELLTI
ncbi:hypothetical protein ACI2JA_03845 [Alkalihalobacillus sp. NPDC078783]